MWHLRKKWITWIINMHCYLMQQLLMAASTLNIFCPVYKVCPLSNYRSSLLWLIFPKAGGAGSAARRVQWGWQFHCIWMEPIVTVRAAHFFIPQCCDTHPSPSVMHVTLSNQKTMTVDHTSRESTDYHIFILEWSEIVFTSRSPCQQGRWRRTESQCFSPQHPRCSLHSMASAHKWRLII